MTNQAKRRRKKKKRQERNNPPPPPPPPPVQPTGPVYVVYDNLPEEWRPFSAQALNEANRLLAGIGYPSLLYQKISESAVCGIPGPLPKGTLRLCLRPRAEMSPPAADGNAYMDYDGNTLLWGMVAIAEDVQPNHKLILHELSHIFTRSSTHGEWRYEDNPFDEGAVIFP